MPEQLQTPPLPQNAAHLWEYWSELNTARGYGAGGPNPISFQDLISWQMIRGLTLDKWEVRAILRLDGAFLSASSKASEAS